MSGKSASDLGDGLVVGEADGDDRVVALLGQAGQQLGAVGAVVVGAELLDLTAELVDRGLDAGVGRVVERAVAAAAGVVGQADLELLAAAAAARCALPPPLSSSLAQAARARLPASSNAAAFVIRARRKTISSLGGRARMSRGASRWVQAPCAASRTPAGRRSASPGHANRAPRRLPSPGDGLRRDRCERRRPWPGSPAGPAVRRRAPTRAAHGATAAGGAAARGRAGRGRRRPRPAGTGRGRGRPAPPSTRRRPRPPRPTSGPPAAGQGARRAARSAATTSTPAGRSSPTTPPAARRPGRVRLAGGRRRQRRGAGRPRPARPLLPGQHAQDADAAHPRARGSTRRRSWPAPAEDENIEGSRVGLVAGRPVPGVAAVPGADPAVGQRRRQRAGPRRRRRRGHRRGDERDRRGARRLRHGRRDAVGPRRRRAVLLALRPGADLPRAARATRPPRPS